MIVDVIIFSIIVVVLFIIVIIAFVNTKTIEPRGASTFLCPPGQCPTNIITGTKRCPENTAPMSAFTEFEVCNSPYLCDNNITPYAVQSDLSTDANGVCPAGVPCRCVRAPACPYYLATAFRPQNGNPYINNPTERFSFSQVLAENAASTDFCTIPFLYLQRNGDVCNITSGDAIDNFIACAQKQVACYTGQLAVMPPDANSFNPANITSYEVGCINVPNPNCPTNTIPVWNKNINQILCLSK